MNEASNRGFSSGAAFDNFRERMKAWTGEKSLWLSPDSEPSISWLVAESSLIIQKQFYECAYRWQYENQPQSGKIIFGPLTPSGPLEAIWLDSWHMRNDIMILSGEKREEHKFYFQGHYAAPPGPDWGWDIEIDISRSDNLQITMWNIFPEGEKMLAVKMKMVPNI